MSLIWGLITLLLGLVEIFTVKFIAGFFFISAFVSFGVSFFDKTFTKLFLIFVCLGFFLLLIFRRWIMSLYSEKLKNKLKFKNKNK